MNSKTQLLAGSGGTCFSVGQIYPMTNCLTFHEAFSHSDGTFKITLKIYIC